MGIQISGFFFVKTLKGTTPSSFLSNQHQAPLGTGTGANPPPWNEDALGVGATGREMSSGCGCLKIRRGLSQI